MKIRTDIILRVYIACAILVLFAGAISWQIVHVQYAEGDKWRAMADSLTTGYREVEAVRGNIYSRDGSLMATSIPQYDIRMDTRAEGLDPVLFYAKVDSLGWHLSRMFGDKSPARYAQLLRTARENGERYYLVKRDVSYKQLKELQTFPVFEKGQYKGGLIAVRHNERILPFRELARRTIGYKRATVQPVGLEGVYDKYIDGQPGRRLMRRIAGGVWIPVNQEDEISPVDGSDIISTIDINIQDVAHHALEKQLAASEAQWGTVILMEVETGEIRAVGNLSRTNRGDYKEAYNYAISFSAEPGSTFKLASFIAGMEDGKFDLYTKIKTGGGVATFYRRTIRDDHHMPEVITMRKAFEQSSNVSIARAIYQGYKDNPRQYTDHLKKMGLGKKLGLQIPGEGRTRIKDPGDKDWWGTTLPWTAHGYEVLITPLQLLSFYNAVANDGRFVKPQFVTEIQRNGQTIKKIEPEVLIDRIASEETIRKAQLLLKSVVDSGTAKNLFSTVYSIAGKTGTAVIADGARGYRSGKRQYQASFCGYFPAENPQYSMIVIINSPRKGGYYGSAVAAPVFKEVADKVYSTRPDMQPGLQDRYPVQTASLPLPAGNREDLAGIYNTLGISFSGTGEAMWGRTVQQDNSVTIKPYKLQVGQVPDLIGMDMQDALFLAENAKLEVALNGSGKVVKQSPRPGTKIENNTRLTLVLK